MKRTTGNSESKLTQTTKTRTSHERPNPKPTADDLMNPKEVWKDAETTPQGDRRSTDTTGHGRVADAGDIGGRSTGPGSIEKQADNVARQTSATCRPAAPASP